MWWNNRRLLTPVQINTLGSKRKEGKRSQSPDVPDESHDQGDARLEMLVNSALELPTETHDGIRLRQRSAANRNGAATPNEIVVEMDELDKVSDDLASTIILRLTIHLYWCFAIVLGIQDEPLDVASADYSNHPRQCSGVDLNVLRS